MWCHIKVVDKYTFLQGFSCTTYQFLNFPLPTPRDLHFFQVYLSTKCRDRKEETECGSKHYTMVYFFCKYHPLSWCKMLNTFFWVPASKCAWNFYTIVTRKSSDQFLYAKSNNCTSFTVSLCAKIASWRNWWS